MPGLTTDALQKPTIVTTQCEERPDTDISSLELDEPVFDAAGAHEAEQTRHEEAVDEKKGRFAVSTYSRRIMRGLRTRRHEADAGIIDRMWCSRCAGGCSCCSPWPSISTDKRRSECCAVVVANWATRLVLRWIWGWVETEAGAEIIARSTASNYAKRVPAR